MHHRVYRFHAHHVSWHHLWHEQLLSLVLALLVVVAPVSAAPMRFQERSLYMKSTLPSVTTSYTISFQYMSPTAISSVDMLFCLDPIPYHPCDAPDGLDVSDALLSAQTGETGFSIGSATANRIVLTRASTPISSPESSYTFDRIVNPSDSSQAFSVRIKSHVTPDATGTKVDFGSVRGQVSEGIVIETQVPPMLIFCLAEEVAYSCVDTNENYYSNMGELQDDATLTAQSQMAVGTNASGGFAITAVGAPLSSGTNVIESLSTPTESRQGTNQFGINLVENTDPTVGNDPEGEWANAVPSPGYSEPNKYKFISGDVIAYSPQVSLMKKFTVSYIVNSSSNLRAGVYSTTISYIASGRF